MEIVALLQKSQKSETNDDFENRECRMIFDFSIEIVTKLQKLKYIVKVLKMS